MEQLSLLNEPKLITRTAVLAKLMIRPNILKKLIEQGYLCPVEVDGKTRYLESEVEGLYQRRFEIDLIAPRDDVVSPKNTLNDLTGGEWLPETKSFFFQKGLGAGSKDAQIERQHPAPFSFQDVGRLITFFTKKGALVLDPFGGVGSTAKACEVNGRKCISIELSEKWHQLSLRRLEEEVGEGASGHHTFINGDSTKVLLTMDDNSVDFVITSPPYWSILNKKLDHKTQQRADEDLATHYSENEADLGNVKDYEEFLNILVEKVFLQCARILKPGKYMALVVSDFRNKSEYISFHSDLIQRMKNRELNDDCILQLAGIRLLLQNHKSLLPYGYPYAFVENIHHQDILIFKKERVNRKKPSRRKKNAD